MIPPFTAAPAIPEGYMQDPQGRLVPVAMVKEIDKLRDQTVRAIVDKAINLNHHLRTFKAEAFSDVAVFVETSTEQWGAKLGGSKGNVTLYTFDGRYRVERRVQELIRFDEQLQAAKALIDECITDWSTGSRDEIKVLVNDAFQVNKEGMVNTQRVLGLARLNITAEKWKRAMEAISASVTVVGSRSYIRVYERVGDTDTYRQIGLDLASV